MTDLEKAKEIFQKENCTLVLCKGDDVFTSDQTGIKKLVELAEGVSLEQMQQATGVQLILE